VNEYMVRQIPSLVGRDYIVANHYTGGCHRRPMCWGLYLGEDLHGVVAFATPSSEHVRASVFGPEHKDRVTELHRLHLRDGHPRNLTTWFLARAFDGLLTYRPQIVAVLSYADTTEGHTGTVYQAANAIYTGATARSRFYRDRAGVLRHPRQCGVNITPTDATARGWVAEMRASKHRYLFILGDRRTKRWANAHLKLTPAPYPKADT
jgi:hypothetical protein